MLDQTKFNKLKEVIENNQRFALFGHQNIDGDAIGSVLWFGGILEKLGKDVSYFTTKEAAKTYRFVDGIKKIRTNFDYGQYDIVFFLDFSDYWRIEWFTKDREDYFDAQKIVVIDHHYGSIPAHTFLEIKDVKIMSNCEIVFEYINEWWPELIDASIATALYLWLTTDSWNFMYDNAEQSERILNNALQLVRKGADKQAIIENLFKKKSWEAVKYMQTVLSRMQKFNGNILVSNCSVQEMDELWLDGFESDYAMVTMQWIEWIDLLLYMKYDMQMWGIRVSFRSSDKVNCSKLAETFGGWGHINASGAYVSVPDRNFEKAKMEIVEDVLKKLEGWGY